MHKRNSSVARPAAGIGINVGALMFERRGPRRRKPVQSLYRRALHWLAGKRADVQIIAVQRSELSIIT